MKKNILCFISLFQINPFCDLAVIIVVYQFLSFLRISDVVSLSCVTKFYNLCFIRLWKMKNVNKAKTTKINVKIYD